MNKKRYLNDTIKKIENTCLTGDKPSCTRDLLCPPSRGKWSQKLLTSECANWEIWPNCVKSILTRRPLFQRWPHWFTGSWSLHSSLTTPADQSLRVWHHRPHHQPPHRHAFSDSSAFYFPSALFPCDQFGQSAFDNVGQMHSELKVGGLGEKQNGLEYVKSASKWRGRTEDHHSWKSRRNGGILVRD